MPQEPIDNQHLERMPPQAVEIEQAVLGAMMLEQHAIGHALEILDPSCFYNATHSRIFETMISLYERGVAVDQFTLPEELKRRDQLDDVGGAIYLDELVAKVATPANIDVHARIVLEKALSRRLIETASDIIEQAYKGSDDVLELINRVEQRLFAIGGNWIGGGIESLETVMDDALEQIERAHSKASAVSGIDTGFVDLNVCTSGLQKGDLIVLAACPGVGKTALALTLARNAAVDTKVGVMIFSPKMSKMQVVQRLLSIETKVDLYSLCTGSLRDEDWECLARVTRDRLARAPIYIDDTPDISVFEARAKARRLHREHGIGLIVVDDLQLMSGEAKTASCEQEISHILRRLKDLAKELDIPVLTLVQLSRAVESRKDPRPQLSDLPELRIEQAADVVMFIYRPDMYGIRAADGTSFERHAEIIIDKQRNGLPGSVYLRWNSFSATYESFGPGWRSPMQLPFYQIDAFTGSEFKGNPAAVMPLETWLDDGTLQAIATENNLSATAFFCPTKEDYVFDLRCFTPVMEVPLCGHATMASAFVLMTEIDRDLDNIEFETRSGRLEVWGDCDIYTMGFPAMNLRPTDRPERIIAAIGAAPATVLRSNNWLFWLLVYDSEDEVAELDVDVSELASALAEADAYAGVICTAPVADRRADFVSRYFAPCHGIPEDPVTGSAHCSLVPYWSERLGRPDRELHALQISARGGELFCRDRGNRVEITGRLVKYMEGTVFL